MRAIVLAFALRLAVALVAAACTVLPPHPPAPDDPTAYPPSSYGLEAGDGGSPCERACAHLAALHCPEARPTKSGVSCPDLCDRASKLEDLPTTCVAGATTLPAVRACGVRCAE